MTRQLFSQSWYSVAELRPRLVPQARIYRHVYRKQVWFVVQDQTGGRYHRLSPQAHVLVRNMDGSRTVQQLWEEANASGSDDICTQNEVVDLLVQLHGAELLQVDTTPDSVALFERYRKKKRQTIKQWLINPTSLKLPLLNPNAFLTRWAPHLAWTCTGFGATLWLMIVLPALVMAGLHWEELTNNLSDRVLSSSNLLVMALVFPLVKLLHELGHGFATRILGGAVNEMGVMFLVFVPAPYVEASSSSAFRSRYQRAFVAAAGMLVELLLAAIALYVWLLTEPGIVRAVAFNTMVIAGFSTLIINGNPLLRYDGYYILSDLIEIPNMAQRGQKYLSYLWDRYVFGALELAPSQETPAEKRWLFLYTPLAWCYRVTVTLGISLFIAQEFFIFGVVLALWGVITLFGTPLWKGYRHLLKSPTLHRRRRQAVQITLPLIAVLMIIGFLVPMPLHTRADGVVWLPDQALLHAGGNGFFQRWLVEPGTRVKRGTPLYLLEDKLLEAELIISRARAAEAEARYAAEQFSDPIKAGVSLRQLEQEHQVLRRSEERLAHLVGYAETDGILITPKPQDMPGQYFKKGELLGYVLEKKQLIARVVVPQDDIYLVRSRLESLEVRLAELLTQTHPAKVLREVPGGVDELPTAALGMPGGGMIPTLPSDSNGVKTIDRVFLFDIALTEDLLPTAFGERVHVRFNLGLEPPAIQGLRRLRQLFLSRFGV